MIQPRPEALQRVTVEQIRLLLWGDANQMTGNIPGAPSKRIANLLRDHFVVPPAAVQYSEFQKAMGLDGRRGDGKLCQDANKYANHRLQLNLENSEFEYLYPALVRDTRDHGDKADPQLILIWQSKDKKAPTIDQIDPKETGPRPLGTGVKTAKAVRIDSSEEENGTPLTRPPSPSNNRGAGQSALGREHIKRLPTGPVISPRLAQEIKELPVDGHVRQNILTLLADDGYPRFMSQSGKLMKNPIWGKMMSPARRRRLLADHPLEGVRAPTILHMDLFLICNRDLRGRGSLYTYFSDKARGWKTFLIPWRARVAMEDQGQREILNASHLSGFLRVESDKIIVTPLAGAYCLSLKPHALSEDLVLYVFEFCSVTISGSPECVANAFPIRSEEGRVAKGKWLTLSELARTPRSMEVNGDVIWYLTQTFGVHLGRLPSSLPVGFVGSETSRK